MRSFNEAPVLEATRGARAKTLTRLFRTSTSTSGEPRKAANAFLKSQAPFEPAELKKGTGADSVPRKGTPQNEHEKRKTDDPKRSKTVTTFLPKPEGPSRAA